MSFEIRKLSEVAEIIMGQSPDGNSYNINGIGLPLLNGAADYKGKVFNPKKFTSSPSKIAIKGDILLGIRATIGNLSISDRDYCIGRGLAAIRINETKINRAFLIHFLSEQISKLINEASGSTIKGIVKEDLFGMQLSLPPLETQKCIADILDAADALRQKDQELLKKYDELAQAIFIDMFGDPVKNEKGWEKFTGKELMEVLGGAAFSSTDYCTDGIPLIRIGTINKGYFDSTQLVYLPESFEEKFKKYIVFPKDLLISLTGTAGKDDYGNVYEMEQAINQGLLNQRVAKLIINKNKINSRYLTYYLKQKDVKLELTGISRGVRQGNISNSDIYNLNIMLPPLVLQNKFDKNIDSILSLKEIQYVSNIKSQELFSSILIKAFNGELVP